MINSKLNLAFAFSLTLVGFPLVECFVSHSRALTSSLIHDREYMNDDRSSQKLVNICRRSTVFALAAKKRRRRKNPVPVEKDVSSQSSYDDDLPDFDLDEDISPEESFSPSKPSSAPSVSMEETVMEAMSDPSVLQAMQAGSSAPQTSSTKDILRSRSRELESTFEFDEVSNPLPRPGMKTTSDGRIGMSKKQAKREARRAAALQAEAEEEEGKLLSSVSDFLNEKASDGGFPKIVELGTWVSIGILVAWEAYINSPFFERAQPLIPVVYEIFNE